MTEQKADIENPVEDQDDMDEGMFEIVDFVEDAVEQIWYKYDVDKNEHLDEAETRRFINDTLTQMKDFRTLEKEEFSIIFNKFDLDRNGIITRKEMTGFILSLAGFC